MTLLLSLKSSFSQNLLETVLLSSQSEISMKVANAGGHGEEEDEVPTSVGGDVPNSVGVSGDNKFNFMFQDDYFERTLGMSEARNPF